MCLISHTVNRSTQTFTPYDSFSSLCEPFLDKVRELNLFGHFKTQLTSNTQHLSTVESALIPVKSTLKLSYGQNGIDTDFETEADVTVEYGYFILNPDFFKLKTLPSGTFKCRWLESQNIGCLSYEVPLNGLSTRNPTLFFFLACNQEQEWTAFYKQTDDTIVSEPLEAVLDIKRERGDEMAYNCSTHCSYCHWIQKTVKPLPTLSLPRLDTISHSKTETLRWSAREFVHYQLVLCHPPIFSFSPAWDREIGVEEKVDGAWARVQADRSDPFVEQQSKQPFTLYTWKGVELIPTANSLHGQGYPFYNLFDTTVRKFVYVRSHSDSKLLTFHYIDEDENPINLSQDPTIPPPQSNVFHDFYIWVTEFFSWLYESVASCWNCLFSKNR